jgi:2-oxoglutarate dehydrogenase E2 component (dihydrolipoamide succinyltransferase)
MEVKVPSLGESVTEATVAKWFKKVGDSVAVDEPLVELETDKVTLEVPATVGGTLQEILVAEGAEVAVGAVLGIIGNGAAVAKPKEAPARPAPAAPPPKTAEKPAAKADEEPALSPAVRKLVEEHGLQPAAIPGSGKDGRLTKGDVLAHLEAKEARPAAPAAGTEPAPAAARPPAPPRAPDARGEERVRMTRLRRRIAERLKEAQNTAAMLTTFNEVDMTAVLAARDKYRDRFEKKHGVRLGFMSFFAKACITALKEIPAVNAEIDGEEIVYRHYVDLGIAVGTEQGLVVPVVRDADKRSFAEIEKEIGALGRKARDGKLTMEDLTGGTFTITNGGVYGSLLSTPILNPPQSGILGMHKIQPRPMAVGDKVEVRPMMYLALSYDHRIIDGSEAVTFLVRVKECIEDPERILLDI